MSKSIWPQFSSKRFIVCCLTFRSLIHFYMIFVYSVRKHSNFILLHIDAQFFQHHLFEETVFSPLYIFATFIKDKMSIGVQVYLSAFYLILLVYISVFVPVPYFLDDYSFVIQSKVRKVDSSSSILLSLDCFGYVGSFAFPYRL